MVDTNTKIQIINTNKSLLETSAISNGSIYFVQDTKELFYDYNSIRSSITDILILATEADRTSVLFTPLNKFYFVLETNALWLYRDGTWYQVSGATEDIKSLLDKKADKADVYTKAEVDSLVSAVYRVKGSVATFDALPTENNAVGDVYNILDTGANYVFTEEGWDKLSEVIDLSGYVEKEEGKSLIADSEIERLAGVTNYDDTAVLEAIGTKQDALTAGENIEIKDNVISVTPIVTFRKWSEE
jgi:hypothetical protein